MASIRRPKLSGTLAFRINSSAAGYTIKTCDALPDGQAIWQLGPLQDGVRNEKQDVRVLQRLRSCLDSKLSAESFPVVIGGDCSFPPTIMSSVTHAFPNQRIGFVYVDIDADLTLPSESSARGASDILDSMTVSSLTHRDGFLNGMTQFCRPDGSPTFTNENAVLFGIDSPGPKPEHFEYLLDNQFRVFSSTAVQAAPKARANEALTWLESRVDMTWLHLDVDVIDSGEFPLGNFPSYGGIPFDKVMTALDCFLVSGKVCGLSVTDINPNNDHDGSMVARLVDRLAEAFKKRQGSRPSF